MRIDGFRRWSLPLAMALCVAAVAATGCVPVKSGLTVLEPDYSTMGDPPKIATMTPTFRWSAFQAPEKAVNVRYHLIVTQLKSDTDLEQIVINKSGLTETAYAPPEPLKNKRRYSWSVRAEYMEDGKAKDSGWSGFRHVWFIGFAAGVTGQRGYVFETNAPE